MNFDESFSISSIMMLTLTVPTLFMIREPNRKKKPEARSEQSLAINEHADTVVAAATGPKPSDEDGGDQPDTICETIKSVSKELMTRVCTDV